MRPNQTFYNTLNNNKTNTDLFLDKYSNLYGESWALYKIRNSFVGDVIEVRRNDGDFQRYAFDSGELPLGAIASFVGGGNGTITYYKGQAQGLELIQPNADNQPWLFKNGVLQEEGGHPTLNFDGNQWLNGGNILNVESRPFVSIVVGNISSSQRGTFYAKSKAGPAPNKYALIYDTQQWVDENNIRNNITASLENELLLANELMVSGVHSVRKNNVEKGSLSGAGNITNSTFDFQIGAYNDNQGNAGGTFHAVGNISSLHIYFEDKLADLSDMNNKINERYGIY